MQPLQDQAGYAVQHNNFMLHDAIGLQLFVEMELKRNYHEN